MYADRTERVEDLRYVSNVIAEAKGRAQDMLERWNELPDNEASSGELERAVELLGKVVDGLDYSADELEQ